MRLDGDMSLDQRTEVMEAFQNSELDILLVSTLCGEGINLCAANRVILMEPGWNPNHDYQAAVRVHRYGQTKPVFIYRLIANESLESKIFQRQLFKVELSKWIVDNSYTYAITSDSTDWKSCLLDPEVIAKSFQVAISSKVLEDPVTQDLMQKFSTSSSEAQFHGRNYLTELVEMQNLFSNDGNSSGSFGLQEFEVITVDDSEIFRVEKETYVKLDDELAEEEQRSVS